MIKKKNSKSATPIDLKYYLDVPTALKLFYILSSFLINAILMRHSEPWQGTASL